LHPVKASGRVSIVCVPVTSQILRLIVGVALDDS
jgi:hypothetical protein